MVDTSQVGATATVEDHLAVEPEAPGARRPTTCLVLVVLAAVLFLGYATRTVAAPFGDSHDGRNAGVWAAGSRSLREDGPARSRLGTRSPEGGVYANHPPLIYLETALAEALAGTSPAATRAPAWLGSLAVIGLLAVLLVDRGIRPGPVGAAVVLAVATPMFLVYGTMLDTPVTSLPFGLALLVLWGRARDHRPVPPLLAGVVAALAALAGWQSLLVTAVLGAWAVVRLVRQRRWTAVDAAFAGGALVGLALLAAWLLWAFDGSLATLRDQLVFRSGQGGQSVPLAELVRSQSRDVVVMFGFVALLAAAGLVAALANRRTRALAAVSLAVTLPYTLLFPAGAANHDYWDYWYVLPLAVGLAAGGNWVLSIWPSPRRSDAMVAAAGGLLAVVAVFGVAARPPAAGWAIQEGVRAGRIAQAAELGPGQGSAWYAGAVGAPATWWALAAGRPAVRLTPDGLARLATTHPRDIVIFGNLRCVDGEPHVSYGALSAVELVARPPEIARCGH